MDLPWHLGDCAISVIENRCTHQIRNDKSRTRVPLLYQGETFKYEITIKRSHSGHDSSEWKNLMSKISCEASLVPKDDDDGCGVSMMEETVSCFLSQESKTVCTIVTTFTGDGISSTNEQLLSSEPFFRDDDTFVFPMSSTLLGPAIISPFVELQVTLSLFTLNSGMRTKLNAAETCIDQRDTCESEEELDLFEEMGRKNSNVLKETKKHNIIQPSSGVHSVVEKMVTHEFKVQFPPVLRLRLATSGQKQFLIMTVSNPTNIQMVVKSIDVLSAMAPSMEEKFVAFSDGKCVKWESCSHVVSLEHPKKHQAFPAIVSPLEELSLIFRLHLSSAASDTELSLRCNIKWTHAGASKEITTIYRLPALRATPPPFVVSVKCQDEPVVHQSFDITYTIHNQLYDFMSMRVYYNADNMRKAVRDKGDAATDDEKWKVKKLKQAVVCHDPVIQTSSCPKGSSIPINVSFQIHQPGLYEISELMKVNLGYSLFEASPEPPSTGSVSSDTISSNQSTEENQVISSRQLWQNRSGSSASLVNPVINPSMDEKRKKFASKSYSFGDLGPSGGSPDSHEGHGNRPKSFQRSSAVPSPCAPPRPPPPPLRKLSQAEQDLIKPSNFFKSPLYVYVKEP